MQLPDYDIVADRDYFFTITANGASEDNATVIENVAESIDKMCFRGNVVTYPGTITVYNLSGQIVATGKDSMSLSHLSRGIYIVQGRNASNATTLRVAIGS